MESLELARLVRACVPADHPVSGDGMRAILRELAEGERTLRVLEVGGGRTPLLAPEECDSLGIEYWVNDISQDELDLVADDYKTARFDIAGAPGELPMDEFDVVFSRSVLEHVADTDRAISNTRSLLRPGGVMIHTFPTLYNPAYLVNKVLPDGASRFLLRRVVHFTYEKFPAKYHKTTSSRRQLKRLESLGFSEAAIVPFWGHEYLHFAPRLAALEARFARAARDHDWRWYSTFAYLAARR